MRISIIVATDLDGVIGRDNALPWRLSADLRRFRRITMGKPIIMGRKTHDSIGKTLDGRLNIVLSRGEPAVADGCRLVSDIDAALTAAGAVAEVMVIGGAAIYAAFLPRADRIYLTVVKDHFEGDVRFPDLPPHEWHEVERHEHTRDDRNPHDYSFVTLER